jgi:hypothetical protein
VERSQVFFLEHFYPAPPQVTWLASWTENISDNIKYIMLNANSRMKGQNDLKKYEKARQLKVCSQRPIQ